MVEQYWGSQQLLSVYKDFTAWTDTAVVGTFDPNPKLGQYEQQVLLQLPFRSGGNEVIRVSVPQSEYAKLLSAPVQTSSPKTIQPISSPVTPVTMLEGSRPAPSTTPISNPTGTVDNRAGLALLALGALLFFSRRRR